MKAAVEQQPAEFDEGEEKNKVSASNPAQSGTRQRNGHRGATREGPGPKGNRSRSRPFKQQTCYNCGQPGHFKAACKADKRPSKCGPTCGLCGDKHSTDRCPQLGAASGFVRQSAAGPSSSSAAKAMPAGPASTTSGMELLVVESMPQSIPIRILADSGSSRNLISEAPPSSLPFEPRVRAPADVRMLGDSNKTLLPVPFCSTLCQIQQSVVKSLQPEALAGDYVLNLHSCIEGKKRFEFDLRTQSVFELNRSDPESGTSVQRRYVDRKRKLKQNQASPDLTRRFGAARSAISGGTTYAFKRTPVHHCSTAGPGPSGDAGPGPSGEAGPGPTREPGPRPTGEPGPGPESRKSSKSACRATSRDSTSRGKRAQATYRDRAAAT